MLEVRGLQKAYGTGAARTLAVADVTFEVAPGEFVCVVGPSGCGKTTLLKCMSGLLTPTSGEVWLNGRRITAPPPEMAVVFQDYSRSLFPWKTVRGNVSLPLKAARLNKTEITDRVEQAIASVGLTKFADHYPWQLSGGMQQRVAIARAMAFKPDILLMDEPFASVDAQTRSELEDMVLVVRQQYGVSVLLVTHDIDESVYLADRVVVLSSPPSSVKEIVEIDLPRPRTQIETKEQPEFAHLRGHVFRLIDPAYSGHAQ